MPPTIYDSSLLTKRQGMKAQAGDYLRRVQAASPQTGYGPRLGIYDQSIIATVRSGNMPYYRKNDVGCTVVNNGCPCQPLEAGSSCCATE